MTRAVSWDGMEVSWDEIKKLLTCGDPSDFDRFMVVAILRDWYGCASTIVVSLNGSPPHAIAVMRGDVHDPEKSDKVRIFIMKVLDYVGGDLKVCKTVQGEFFISLNELKKRKDVVLTTTQEWLGCPWHE